MIDNDAIKSFDILLEFRKCIMFKINGSDLQNLLKYKTIVIGTL